MFLSSAVLAAPDRSGFQPRISAQLQYEDNVRRTPDQNKQSDSVLIIKPKLPLLWDFGKHKLNLAYNGEYGQYFDQQILNYNDHKLSGHLLLDHNTRLNSEYELGYVREHDIPDDNNVVANLTAAPNQWKENYAKTKLTYGTPASTGQLMTNLIYKQRSYTNNSLQALDANRLSLTGTFYYRIAPKTRLPFEVSLTNYDYQNTSRAFDPSSKEYKYLTGVTWDASAKSTGIFQLGLLKKNYDNNLYEDTSIVIIRLDTVWEPNTYTKIVMGATRDTRESFQINTKPYVQNHIQTKITHRVTPRTTLLFGARYTAAKTDGLAALKDNIVKVRLEVKHSLLLWLNASAGYKYVERDSNQNRLDFKSNIVMLKIEAQFDH